MCRARFLIRIGSRQPCNLPDDHYLFPLYTRGIVSANGITIRTTNCINTLPSTALSLGKSNGFIYSTALPHVIYCEEENIVAPLALAYRQLLWQLGNAAFEDVENNFNNLYPRGNYFHEGMSLAWLLRFITFFQKKVSFRYTRPSEFSFGAHAGIS